MAYTAEKPRLIRTTSELREQIPGWGVDLDRSVRPAVPKENFRPDETGAHWDFPVRQVERFARERSTEHKFLTPVFGTVCPPKGISGAVRRFAYTFSEGRMAHWLLLAGADRIDVLEHRVKDMLNGRPDDVIAESGVLSELKRNGFASRRGQHRSDIKHQPLDLALTSVGLLLSLPKLTGLTRQSRHKPNGKAASSSAAVT
jgi:hypothetical protein